MIENLLASKNHQTQTLELPAKLRVLLFVLVALVTVLSNTPMVLGGLALFVGYFWLCSRLSLKYTFKRLLAMDFIVLFTVILIPFSVQGEPLFSLLGLPASIEGSIMALTIIVKANIVILAVMSLSVGIDSLALSQALYDLGVPKRFSILMQFTVRYIGVLHHEFKRLRQAMLVRGFKASNSLHTWRSYGYLLGMLLVRSFDRAERVLQAMKCRGFNGQFMVKQKSKVSTRELLTFSGYLLVLLAIISLPFGLLLF